MRANIQKWGNSQGLRLPRHLLREANIEGEQAVELFVEGSRIVIERIERPKFNLAELVSRMPKNYKVQEEDFGRPTGKEAW